MPVLFRNLQPIQGVLPTPEEPATQVVIDNHQDLLALLTTGPKFVSELLANSGGFIECLVTALAHLEISGQIEHFGTLYQLRER